MKLKFTIPIAPKPWQRPRFNNGRGYTAPTQEAFKREFLAKMRPFLTTFKPFNIPLNVKMSFFLGPPKKPKFKHPAVRPDLDNYAKVINDFCNGLLWTDDALICDLHVKKLYCWVGEPRIEIELEPLE